MLDLPETVRVYSLWRECEVNARIVSLSRSLAASEVDGKWWKLPISRRLRDAEEDHHWTWRKLVGERRNDAAWGAVALANIAGSVEGAMLYRIDAKSQLEPGKGAVYVDRLAVAPRSRPWLVSKPRYRGVGSVLLLAAVRESYSLGLGGRAWLTSLPSERTQEFYRKRGFQRIFADERGTIDFELPDIMATQWLRQEGYL